MLHHVSLGVADLERAAAFYDAALACLGYVRVWEDRTAVGYGIRGGGDKLAIKLRGPEAHAPGPGFHLALAAPSRQAAAAFHAAGLRAGGRDNGAPGLRPEYGPDYYAAFVIDPDGHRLEAVINGPPGGAVELKAFVPAKDYALSKRFYQDVGFSLASDTEGVAYFHFGDVSFLLQDFYVEALAHNLMMHLLVDDVDAWWHRLQQAGIAAKYGVRIGSIERQPWKMRDFVLFDPSGVLWRIAQNSD